MISKRLTTLAAAAALLGSGGVASQVLVGTVTVAAFAGSAPVIKASYDAQQARLAADRAAYAGRGRKPARGEAHEAGDAEQDARQTDPSASDSPDMPRRLDVMLRERERFLRTYESRGRASDVQDYVSALLRDDAKALAASERALARERAAERDPAAPPSALARSVAALRALHARVQSLAVPPAA